MIVVMKHRARRRDIERIAERLEHYGFEIHLSKGGERTIIGVVGDGTRLADLPLGAMPGVDKVLPVLEPYKLVSREFKENTVVEVGGIEIGAKRVHIIAGPCAIESREQLMTVAKAAKEAGATVLRGGAYKPRTSPYSFQGMMREGLEHLKEVGELTGLPVVTEIMDPRMLPVIVEYADILQIGARNMQNYVLLREVGKTNKPVLLKRGQSGSIKEWLLAAEYIMSAGNYNVILCERGIKTFEEYLPYTLDLSAVPVIKHLSHLPVVVDPSHAVGKWTYVPDMAKAAIAAGADGLLIEVHPNPEEALCDGEQSLNCQKFSRMMVELKKIAAVIGREI